MGAEPAGYGAPMDFRTVTVAELAARVSERSMTAGEVVASALDRIERLDGELGAFVAVDADAALAEAEAIDQRIAAGDDVGPLAGVPLAVKDLEDAAGYVTSRGSVAFAGDPPAAVDSPLVERLRAAGCVVVGKTNTPELGYKPDTVNELFGATHNPWAQGRSAGGSSGGSAAAIAAGLVPLATGSDGGGSIRIPAAVTGLTGLKPSLGRVPTRGPITRRARDLALALDVVVGPEATDLSSLPLPDASWSRSLAELHPPRLVGWSPTLGYARPDSEVLAVCESAVRTLEAAGTEVVVVDRVFETDPIDDWLALTSTWCLRTLEHLAEDEMWGRIDPGLVAGMEWSRRSVTAPRFARALDGCHTLNLALVELFHRVPLLLTPTVAGQTPVIGEPGTIDGEPEPNWVRYTYPFNMTRSPAGTVCAGFTSDGMPVGLQVVGPQHADVAVLRLLTVLEDLLDLDAVAPFGGG
jgi:aspartyl-tRNA(Asn)/glutamyl-tRNA(Gln) amidotransferase subunit A